MSQRAEPTVDELLDQAEQDRLEQKRLQEEHELLYGDLDEENANPTPQEGSVDLDEDMDVILEENPTTSSASGCVGLNLDGFGSGFINGLQRFLDGLRPFATRRNDSLKEKVFSANSRVKMTEQSRKASTPLFEELLDAILLDRGIRFRRVEYKPRTFTTTKELFCPCEMVHAAVLTCPHYADRHHELCQEAVVLEDKKAYEKKHVS